jgi:nucleotide-binding universal stress UspA family protein
MSYKTILVHAGAPVHAAARIRYAASLATLEGAHLVGAAMTGISRFMDADAGLELERTVVAGYFERLRGQAGQALARFESLARAAGVRSLEARLVADDAAAGLVLLSRFADLVVLGQSDPGNADPTVARDLPEYVVLNAPRPVLLVPYAGEFGRFDGKALVAWNGSPEASRALGHALPLLRHASEVLVAQFNPDAPDALQEQEADLTGWLGRHGIRARIQSQPVAIDGGNALLSLAADQQAGLIVMGGYGHTRFRELLLGGVTRTVLESMTVPVLMSH